VIITPYYQIAPLTTRRKQEQFPEKPTLPLPIAYNGTDTYPSGGRF